MSPPAREIPRLKPAAAMSEEADPASPEGTDEPTRPIDDALTRAAREAQAGPYIPGGRFRPPNSLAILALVLLGIAAGAIYFIYFAASSMDRTDRIRLRTLEQKLVDYDKQQRFLKANGYVPAGPTHLPLTNAEQAELRDLRQRYGAAVRSALPATSKSATQTGE
jgi:hypothetical protein